MTPARESNFFRDALGLIALVLAMKVGGAWLAEQAREKVTTATPYTGSCGADFAKWISGLKSIEP